MDPAETLAHHRITLIQGKGHVSLPSLSQSALHLFPLSSEKESDLFEITQLAGAAPDPRATGQSCSPLGSSPEWSLATTLLLRWEAGYFCPKAMRLGRGDISLEMEARAASRRID